MTLTLTLNEKIWGYHWTRAAGAYYKIQKNYKQELEIDISQSPYWSYEYARNILKTPFPLGEPAIADSLYSLDYSIYVLKSRFKLLELNLTDKSLLLNYTKRIMELNHE